MEINGIKMTGRKQKLKKRLIKIMISISKGESTLEIPMELKNKDMEPIRGMMAPPMSESGRKISPLAKESLQMLQVIRMTGSGKTTKLMDMEFSNIKKHKQFMKVFGKTICNTVQDLNGTRMEADTKECTRKGGSMVRAVIIFPMEQSTEESGKTEKLKVMEYAHGEMVENMRVSGWQTRKMDRVSLLGQTNAHIKENTRMINGMVRERIVGGTEGNTWENGKTTKDTVGESTF